jgi:hypothetical protein
MRVLCVSREGLSSVCQDFRFCHCGSVDFGLPNNPGVDARMVRFQPFGEDVRCVAQAGAVGEQHDAVDVVQGLRNPVVESQIFSRALPFFTQFVAVVQVMQEMMRIVGNNCFSVLIRRKVDPVELGAVMVSKRQRRPSSTRLLQALRRDCREKFQIAKNSGGGQ